MSVQEADQSHPATTLTWTIKNFELSVGRVRLSSPEFSVITCPTSSFFLVFEDEDDKENSKYFSLFLRKNFFSPDGYAYSFVIGIITRDRKQNFIKFDTAFKNEHEHFIGEKKFIEKEKLMYSEKQLMLPDGNLTLFCEVSVCKVPLYPEEPIHLKEFSDAFLKLYESGKYSDATVEVQGKSFKIHKAIIVARFPDIMNNLNGSVCKIENISVKTVEAILRYLYSGYLKVSDVNVYEVFTSDYKIPKHLQSLLFTEPYLQHQKIKAVSVIGKKDISFTLKIHNFKSLEPGKCRCFRFEREQFMVFLTVSKNKKYLIISIERSCKKYKKMICNIKISRVTKSFFHCFDNFGKDRWTMPGIPLQDIFNEEINFSHEYNVNVDFKISVPDRLLFKETQTTIELFSYEDCPQNNAEDLLSLRNNLRSLYNESTFSDVLLKSETYKIRAHKCILSARSTTFADILENESAVKDTEVVIDLGSEIAHCILFYIYSCRLWYKYKEKLDKKSVIDLYNAADKYKLPGLRRKCSELLKKSMDADMEEEVFIVAYDYDDELAALI